MQSLYLWVPTKTYEESKKTITVPGFVYVHYLSGPLICRVMEPSEILIRINTKGSSKNNAILVLSGWNCSIDKGCPVDS